MEVGIDESNTMLK